MACNTAMPVIRQASVDGYRILLGGAPMAFCSGRLPAGPVAQVTS